MYFPVPLYVILLWFWWRSWRKRGALDRNESLSGYVLAVCTTWAFVFITLIPSQEYASAYGVFILTWSTIVAVIVLGIGALVYLSWPIAKPVLNEPDRQPEITLHLQPTLRNKLETLHAKLTDSTTLAISWFESDIERMGYLKALQDLSPELVASFNEMRKLAMDLMPNENNPITHKEAREQLGDKEYEKQASSPSRTVNVSWINVWWDRERNNPELQASINKVKMQIQDLIAKSN